MRSLTRFLSGQDVKSADLVALADATGVRVEWLAAGRGPMRASSPEAAPLSQVEGPAASREPALAFTPANVDRLTEAIRRAQRLYAEENRLPSPRRFAQILLLLYDELGTAEKSSDTPET